MLTKEVNLKQAIFAKRPLFGKFLEQHGNSSLEVYFNNLRPADNILWKSRQNEFLQIVEEVARERFGRQIAHEVCEQLKNYPLVSTTDHHAPIDHPFFVNANIIQAVNSKPEQTYLVVLSCASVSVNNASGYPRGLLYHVEDILHRLPILPDKLKMTVTYACRGYGFAELNRAINKLQLQSPKLGEFFKNFFLAPDVIAAPDLTIQLSRLNFLLWPAFFTVQVPKLIYLDIETITTRLLIKHLQVKTSVLYRLLCDNNVRAEMIRLFNIIPGAFTVEQRAGTQLFWGLNAVRRRLPLEIIGSKLIGGNVTWSLEPAALIRALENKEIFPSMMLCYVSVALYYGLTCLGGFSQIHELTLMKHAWVGLLEKFKMLDESVQVKKLVTDAFSGDGILLARLKNFPKLEATGLDLALERSEQDWMEYKALQQLTINELIEPMLPEIYKVLYGNR